MIRQLMQIDLALQSGADVEVFSYLVEGARVRVRSGPLKGLEGVVKSTENGSQVVLNIDMIQQSVAMKVDRSLIEPVL